VHRRGFIGIVAHASDLWRKDGAAALLRALGAPVRTLPFWGDPDALFCGGDDDATPGALVVEALDRPDLGVQALQALRRHARLERVGALLAVTERQVTRIEPSCGFDDFVLLPYVSEELLARVSEVERRNSEDSARQRMVVGDLLIDPVAHEVVLNGRLVHLSALAFEVLTYLARHRGRLVSRDELLKHVWGADYLGGARTVDVCVCHLRAKLGTELPLTTIRGAGYRLEIDGAVGLPIEIEDHGMHLTKTATKIVAKSRRSDAQAARSSRVPRRVRPFIKVTEVWVPNEEGTHLSRGEGLYGPHDDFNQVSAPMRFARGEGLPGRAWAERQPIVLKELGDSYFKRADAAGAARLTCGVALPIFSGEFLLAVLTFLCGDEEEHVGAIELWGTDPVARPDMGLIHGYYGTAEVFEKDSRSVTFRAGAGLPGRVWKTGMPVIMDDLGRSQQFVRSKSALKVGIEKGLGIPCSGGRGQAYVMTFLSAPGTPIARRFEVWEPSGDRDALVFSSGQCDTVADLASTYASVRVRRGDGLIGRVGLTGVPSVSDDLASSQATESARGVGLSSGIAMPIIDRGLLKCVVAWYF
jgi:DNA-binding response OmpR family regulator